MLTIEITKDSLETEESQNILKNIIRKKTKHKILYVNQDNSNNYLIEHILKNTFNSETFTAATYNEACEVIRNKKLDLVILDINLPCVITIEFLKKMKGNLITKSIPVLAIYENDMLNDYKGAFGVDLDELIVKPVSIGELTDTINKLM